MTTAGYYDYASTVALARPVAITGHPGSPFREVAYDLAALTGLPLQDLDHRMEHEAGTTLWSLARRSGLAALHWLEGRLLPAVLSQRPPGLVVLGEGALLDPERLADLGARAALVFLRDSPVACYWALRQRAAAQEGPLGHPWLPDRLEDPEDLRPLLGLLRPVMAAADRVIDMEDTTVHDAVRLLQAALPELGAARQVSCGEPGGTEDG